MLLKNEIYGRGDLVTALKEIGLRQGDLVFLQMCHESLGRLQDNCSVEKEPELLCSAVREVVGSNGTLVSSILLFLRKK